MFNAFIFTRTHACIHMYIALDNDMYAENVWFDITIIHSFIHLFVRSFVHSLSKQIQQTHDVYVHRYYINSQNFCLFIWNVPWQYDAETTYHSSMPMLLLLQQQRLMIIHFIFHIYLSLCLYICHFKCMLFYFYCRNESMWNVRNGTVFGVNFSKCVASHI